MKRRIEARDEEKVNMLVGVRVQQKQIEELEKNNKSLGKQIHAAGKKHNEHRRHIEDTKEQKNALEAQVSWITSESMLLVI